MEHELDGARIQLQSGWKVWLAQYADDTSAIGAADPEEEQLSMEDSFAGCYLD